MKAVPAALLLAASLLTPAAVAGEASSPLSALPAYQVTEHAPVIKGRQDRAFQRALEAAFRKALVTALRDIDPSGREVGDFSAWQSSIFSRASDFIASYQVLSQSQAEGYLTLTVVARIQRDRLERALESSTALSPLLPVRLLVLVDNFPLSGTGGVEDIDAGHTAGGALESAFLRQGAIIIPSPERLPWQDLDGQASAENRLALATDAGRRLGADYVVLGDLESRADMLLVLSAELISVSSEKTLSAKNSPVELQPDVPPQDNFYDAAGEIALLFSRRLSPRTENRPPSGGEERRAP